MRTWDSRLISLIIFMLALLAFVPFLGGSHLFDWDEINFAEAAREMLVTGEFSYVQINFQPFWEKPPLFIWMQAASMSLFGINEFAARLPNAICGALTLTILFNIGNRFIDRKFGLLWVLVYAGSILSQFYFRSGIIDPWYNLFIFLGIHQLILASSARTLSRRRVIYSALLIGLAILTKGPTALALVGLIVAIYFVRNYSKHDWKLSDVLIYLSVVLVVGFSWYMIEVLRGHGYVVREFIDYHIRLFSESEAGHGQPWFYHPLVLLVGCFPMSLFFIFYYTDRSKPSNAGQKHYLMWMNILFWVVLVVFSIVKTKIVHYSSLTYFPISMMATYGIYRLMNSEWQFKIGHSIVLLFFSVILGTSFVLIGILDKIKQPLLSLIENDPYALATFSQTIPDGRIDGLIGILFLVGCTVSIFWLSTNQTKKGIVGLFGTTLVTISLLSMVIIPKIDRYRQEALFQFYRSHAKTHYLKPIGYSSYAHLFYGERQPMQVNPEEELNWLLNGEVDRPVYFISRVHNVENMMDYAPNLKKVQQIGGYIILERIDGNYPFLGSR